MMKRQQPRISRNSIPDSVKFIENKIGRKIFGVRNHCLVREVLKTQKIENGAGFLYESNIPDTDNCVPNYKNRGCTFFYPYHLNGVLILPLTLHDWTFIAGNKYPDKESMQFYLKKLKFIHDNNGLMTALFHSADYMTGAERLWMYERFLQKVSDMNNIWVGLPKDIHEWTKQRDKIKFEVKNDEDGLKIKFLNDVCTLAIDRESFESIKNKKLLFSYKSKPLGYDVKKVGNFVLFCFINNPIQNS